MPAQSVDAFRTARVALAVTVLICCLSLLGIVALTAPGASGRWNAIVAFVDAFDQDAPALCPSGRLLRSAEIRHRAVAMRPAPHMPFPAPDPAFLLLTPTGPLK